MCGPAKSLENVRKGKGDQLVYQFLWQRGIFPVKDGTIGPMEGSWSIMNSTDG
jgi:hypothetical protein